MSGISRSIARPVARPLASPLAGGGGGVPVAPGEIKSFRVLGDEQIDPISGIGANGSGWAAEVVLKGITSTVGTLDATKLVVEVSDPGYDATGAAVTRTRTIRGGKYIRRQYPNHADKLITTDGTDLTLMISLDDWVYAGSTIVSVSLESGFYTGSVAHTSASKVNESDLAYTVPLFSWINPQNDLSTGSFPVECVTFHRHAMSGRQAACIKIQATDGTNVSPEITVADTDLSTFVTKGNIPEVWKATLDTTGLNDATTCTVNAKVYPWLGDTILDLPVNGVAWPTSLPATPLRVFNDKTGGYSGGFAYVQSGAVGGAASGVAATAKASPYPTYGTARAGLQAWRNTNKGQNNLGGGSIRFMDDAGADITHTITTAIGGTAGATWCNVESDPDATGVVTLQWDVQQAAPDLMRYRNLKFLQGSSTYGIAGPNSTRSMVCIDNCSVGVNSVIWYDQKYIYNITNNAATNYDAFSADKTAICIVAGVVDGSVNIPRSTFNAHVAIGCIATNGASLTVPVIAKADGGHERIFYNNRIGGLTLNTSVARTMGRGCALVQNLADNMVIDTVGTLTHFADSDLTEIQNVVEFHDTCAGDRASRLYNDNTNCKVAPYGIQKLGVSKFNIWDNYNIKTDVFNSGVGSTGNWAYYHSVGNFGNVSLFGAVTRDSGQLPNPHTDNYLGAHWHSSSEYNLQRAALGLGQSGVMDLFANYTVAPRAVPAAGGNYQPLSTATLLKNRVPAGKSVLKYDIAGNLRKTDGTGAAGAYEAAP